MSQHLCGICDDAVRIRKRDLSDEAVSTLVVLGALLPAAVGRAMCDVCFAECRELLIEVQGESLPPAYSPTQPVHLHSPRDEADLSEVA